MKVIKKVLFLLSFAFETLLLLNILLFFAFPIKDIGNQALDTNILVFLILTNILVIFLQYKYIKKNPTNKTLIFIIIFTIGLYILFGSSILIQRINFNKNIQIGKNTINNYLISNFGEKNTSNTIVKFSHYSDGCHIICTDSPTWNYNILHPLLDQSYNIAINSTLDNIINDEFINKLVEEYDLINNYEKLTNEQIDLPRGVKLKFNLNSFDINNMYKSKYTMEELLNRAQFVSNNFELNMDTWNEDDAIAIIKKTYLIYLKYFKENSKYISFYIYADDQTLKNNTHFASNVFADGSISKADDLNIKININGRQKSDGKYTTNNIEKILSLE